MPTTTMFQYFSDVHTEFMRDERKVQRTVRALMPQAPRADCALLAGDLGRPLGRHAGKYAALLSEVSARFPAVFVVAGNHEFYGDEPTKARPAAERHSMAQVADAARAACAALPNVVFLDDEASPAEVAPGLRVFGGTLWTDLPPASDRAVLLGMNDFASIPGMTPDEVRRRHARTVAALRAAMDEDEGAATRWVVVTHHLPLRALLNRRYRDVPSLAALNDAYASDVALARDPRVAAWVHGHSHFRHETPPFFACPIGYPGEVPGATMRKTFAV